MPAEFSSDVFLQAVRVLILLLAPMALAVALAALIVGAFQAVTNIRDQAIAYTVRLLVVVVVIYVLLPTWMEGLQELGSMAWDYRKM